MLSSLPLLFRTQRVMMTMMTPRPHMVMSTTVPVLEEELHCSLGPGPWSQLSSPASRHLNKTGYVSVYKCTVRHLVTSLVEAGDRRRRLELVSPRVCDISTEVTWFRVMLSSAALR